VTAVLTSPNKLARSSSSSCIVPLLAYYSTLLYCGALWWLMM